MKRSGIFALVFASLSFFLSLPLSAQEKNAVKVFEQACQKQEAEDFYSAVELYRETLEINPRYAQAWHNLSLCTYFLGEYELALEYVDNALKFSSNQTDVKNLKGMILLCLGKIDEASAIFKDIMTRYPNNVDARFGLAQIDLMNGSLTAAQTRYLDALKRDATNRKALLSLALVSAGLENNAAAEKYIKLALEYHSGESGVHYLAAYLAALRGDFSEAEKRAQSAVQINPNYDRAYELLGEILYAQKRYSEVCDICDFRIGRNRNLSSAWYLKGKALEKRGEYEKAIAAWTTGLSVNPQDEFMRLGMEQLVDRTVPLEDSRRRNWAKFHADKAANFRLNLNSEAERYEYQKALSLSPEDEDVRRKFAALLERDSLYELYLFQLKFIKENHEARKTESAQPEIQKNENTPAVKKTPFESELDDTIEALESLLEDNLSSRWNVKPFYLDKSRWKIGLYYQKNPVAIIHPDSEDITAGAVKNLFDGVACASVYLESQPVASYAQAYSSARNAQTDYFVIIETDETERSFALDAKLYSTRTGTLTSEFHIYKTGNDRVAKTLRRLRSSILAVLPIRGRILQLRGDKVLADLGHSDGIQDGAVFDVVRKGSILTKDSGPGVFYPSQNVIGTFTATKVDEEICEGDFVKKGFYNVLNTDDELILIKSGEDSSGGPAASNAATETRPQADSQGQPATAEAQIERKNEIAESLKEKRRESTLVNMIRSVF